MKYEVQIRPSWIRELNRVFFLIFYIVLLGGILFFFTDSVPKEYQFIQLSEKEQEQIFIPFFFIFVCFLILLGQEYKFFRKKAILSTTGNTFTIVYSDSTEKLIPINDSLRIKFARPLGREILTVISTVSHLDIQFQNESSKNLDNFVSYIQNVQMRTYGKTSTPMIRPPEETEHFLVYDRSKNTFLRTLTLSQIVGAVVCFVILSVLWYVFTR